MKIELPQPVVSALTKLEKAGFEGEVVGGCVRDTLLGKAPSDWDITTSALPREVMEVFAGQRVLETGLQHGTVTLLLEGMPLELTTYRIDGEYRDHRRPREVTFTRSLGEDLARRDFTINAMAYHPLRGLTDPFGGHEDLKAGLIRAVGEPDKRFEEDALRILRGLRFASVLGFDIQQKTARSMSRNRELLGEIAAERIAVELTKLLVGRGAETVLREHAEVLWQVLPELRPMAGFHQHNPHHCYDVWEHTLHSLSAVEPNPELRLSMLLHDAGKPDCFTLGPDGVGHFYGHPQRSEELARRILTRLRFDKQTIHQVATLVRWHDAELGKGRSAVKRWLNRLGEGTLRQLLAVKRADVLAQEPTLAAPRLRGYSNWEELMEAVLREPPCFALGDLAVDGRMLIGCGIPPGPQMGKILKALLNEVLEERLPNEVEPLLGHAVKLYEERKEEYV